MIPEVKTLQKIDVQLIKFGLTVEAKGNTRLIASRGVGNCELLIALGETDYSLFVNHDHIGK